MKILKYLWRVRTEWWSLGIFYFVPRTKENIANSDFVRNFPQGKREGSRGAGSFTVR